MIRKNLLLIFSTVILLAAGTTAVSGQPPVNPNATTEAVRLKAFLDSIYGKKILSGQAFESVTENWLSIINDASGKQPAILSLDFMNSTPWRVEHGADPDTTTGMAIDWVKNKGGIVEMHWHWDAPKNTNFSTWQGFYSKNTTFDLTYALSDTSLEDYKLLIRDMDIIATRLKRMQDSGIAILWRPLHEAEGTWFWWGAKGGNSCKALYRLLYDRLVNYHGINNLIWVWNSYGTTKENWYPGDDVVDIIAWDYPDYNASSGSWSQYEQLFGDKNKLWAIGEDDNLVDPDILEQQHWLYFITWAYMIQDPSKPNGKNTPEWINTVFNDSRVITLDDLVPGPKAKAGRAQLILDMDGDSVETVNLDGSESYTDSGTIVSYVWTENDIEIATGATPMVELGIGTHIITLTVTTSTSESKSATVVITVKTPSLSLNKPTTVSSTEAGSNLAQNAVDGDLTTRWSSLYADPQWFQIDLGKPYNIQKVILYWEVASGKNYRIDESNDGILWTTVIEKNNLPNGQRTDVLDSLPGGARYIRLYGSARTSSWGYSLFEFEVYGNENANAEPVGTPVVSSIQPSGLSSLQVYPTIVKENEFLSIRSMEKIKEIKIYTILGENIMNRSSQEEDIRIAIDERFKKGMYLIRIESESGSVTKRFIVE